MELNKIIQPSQYSINNSSKPAIQMQNFFRIDHNTKNIQNQNKLNNKNVGVSNPANHQYEIYLSSRSKSKERDSDNSYINKPKIIFNNLPPEFNINKNNNVNNGVNNNNINYNGKINNFLLGTKNDMEMKIKINNNNKTNSLTNIHYNNLSSTTNNIIQNNKKTNINNINIINKKANINNHFKTEGSEFEITKENIKNIGNSNNFTSTGFKSFNISNIKNGGKTLLKYNKNEYINNSDLSEIEEILNRKKDKIQKRKINQKEKKDNSNNTSSMNKKINNLSKNGIKPIKLNNYNNNYQRKVIPPIMNKDKFIFDNESLFSIKKTQISNINNINYSKIQKNNKSNSNLNLFEQQGKTYTNFKNEMKFNDDNERKSLPIKNINNDNNKESEKPKFKSRPSSEDNNKINYEINKTNININEKDKINSKIEELILTKKIPNNLNEGLFYKYYNGYKYYFDLKNIDCYLFKDISDNNIQLIEQWKNNYRKCKNYLKILGYKQYEQQSYYSVVLEYPIGGENFNDIINSIGFYDIKLLLNISQIIYECFSFIKNDKNNSNIIFCLCDIYLNSNKHIKIIPPFIRNINIEPNINNDKLFNKSSHCQCKNSIFKIIKLFNYNKNSISLICFGFILLQLITQNLLFKMNSFNNLINNDTYISKYKKCCFLHTLLNIESDLFDSKNDLLISHFIKLYPECVMDFIHICTQFNYVDNNDKIYKHEFLNMYGTSSHIEIYFKELLKIITFDSKYNHNDITFDSFLEKFESIYKNIDINPYIFYKVLHHKKILNTLMRAFNIHKNSDSDKFIKIIEKKDILNI